MSRLGAQKLLGALRISTTGQPCRSIGKKPVGVSSIESRENHDCSTAANLNQITLDIQSPMENAQYVDIVVWFYQVGDPVVTVKEDPDFT